MIRKLLILLLLSSLVGFIVYLGFETRKNNEVEDSDASTEFNNAGIEIYTENFEDGELTLL
ncbi:MAG: hypothetical protein Q9M91_05540 [Candidatus Dojkabacteria bacterium]|nr:hypothetical protein [Candidatus Dojkabacteria bacterium]